jgi:hypothetical protein
MPSVSFPDSLGEFLGFSFLGADLQHFSRLFMAQAIANKHPFEPLLRRRFASEDDGDQRRSRTVHVTTLTIRSYIVGVLRSAHADAPPSSVDEPRRLG